MSNREQVISEVEQLIIEHFKTIVSFVPLVEEFKFKWIADKFNSDIDKFEKLREYLQENLK